ncbi:hypothetical protein C4564_03920 [Candidatus Microgenomates bacterium]|nr:MAG: hypothetical protein C4564_03920 [Candidatus Microgenomates bacterium]
MQKEAVIALLIGSSIGLLVAFGVWRLNKSMDNNAPARQEEIVETKKEQITLSLLSPENNSVSSKTPVKISGIATQNTYIVAASKAGSTISLVGANSEFQEEVELNGGINDIQILNIDNSAQVLSRENVRVVYSTQLNEADKTSETTDSARNTEPTLNAYMGTVTDITDSSLQIRSQDGQIVQIAVDKEEASFANIVKATKGIEYSDIAIGDFVIVVGYTNGTQSVHAKRVLVSTEAQESQVSVISGSVKELSSKEFIVETNNQEYSIDATGKVLVTAMKDGQIVSSKLTSAAEKGSRIIIIGEIDNDELVASRVHVLPQ